MRLWHKWLIPVLPRQQLISQYRENNAIMKAIAENNAPNHILVNKVMDYPIIHFATYHKFVLDELRNRNYKTRADAVERFKDYYKTVTERNFEEDALGFFNPKDNHTADDLFMTDYEDLQWHNRRYYIQCLYNLQEKYDCGGISKDEWELIVKDANMRGIDID